MRALLQRVVLRIAAVFGAAAFLAYSAWIVSLIESTTTWSALALAAVLLVAPLLAARGLRLRIVRVSDLSTGNSDTEVATPPLIGLELRIPDYQCEAFAPEVAALVGAGARVVAVDPVEFQAASLVKPSGGMGGSSAMLTILRKEGEAAVAATPSFPVAAPASNSKPAVGA